MPRTGKKKKSALASDYQYSDDDEDVINDSEAHVESFFEDAPRAKRTQIVIDKDTEHADDNALPDGFNAL